jgi:DNA-binding XRE family transcriptional regulator
MKPNLFLRLARINAGLTQEDLADALGTSAVSVSRWERGENIPSKYFRQKICALFRLSEQELGWPVIEDDEEGEQDFPQIGSSFLLDPCLPTGRATVVGQQSLLKDIACSPTRTIGLIGLPGSGKTAVAQALAAVPEIRQRFEGVVWATLGQGQESNPLRHFHRWFMLLGGQAFPAHLDEAQDLLRVITRERRLIIVLDDVWAAPDIAPYRVGGPQCRYVLTTRQPALANSLCERVYSPRTLTGVQAFHLLTGGLPALLIREHREAFRSLSQQVGNLPGMLEQMGRYLRREARSRSRRRFQEALTQLFHPPFSLQIQLSPDMDSFQQRIRRSEQVLPVSSQFALSLLAAHFPSTPATFSERQVIEFFQAHRHLQLADLDRLVDAGLLSTAGRNRYQLHPVIAAYARLSVPSDEGGASTAIPEKKGGAC